MQHFRVLRASSSNALRFSCRFFFVAGFFCSFWIVYVRADCWYDNDRYKEGEEVVTVEPCLNCTCSRGVLLCYLRVCPKLPNPPPRGCILLHRYRTCCPELICTDFLGADNSLESRSEPDDDLTIPFDRTILKNACVTNGSVYGPGSAMGSSSLCEYCYCLGGKQVCVKPKCLLPIDGCTPTYDPNHCCPIRYKCQHPTTITSSTTTEISKELEEKGGCLVDGVRHPEGGKVLGVGHSACDNCYCLKGVLRCEPLSCAPPLLGCSPVIKPGECCAASYNCSGTIEIQPEPNYGKFPIVSKEYAKLRKEVQKNTSKPNGIITVPPSYIFPETSPATISKQRSTGTFGTTKYFTGISFYPSTAQPNNHDMSSRETHKQSTRSYPENKGTIPGVYYATTNYEFQNRNYKRVLSTTNKPQLNVTTENYKNEHTKSPDYLDSIGQNIFSLFESFLNETPEDDADNITTTTDDITSTIPTTLPVEAQTETDQRLITEDENVTTTETVSTITNLPQHSYPLTVKSVITSTDCVSENDTTLELPESNEVDTTTIFPELRKQEEGNVVSTVLEDVPSTTEQLTTTKPKTATLRNIPDIEAILNITKQKVVDYEYDYNEPSLPPSLPNLKIIPFVAADAVDSKKDVVSEEEVVYSQDKVTDPAFGYTNLFSPPTETEGGFVPKEPPILDDNYYQNAVTAPSLAGEIKQNANCVNHDGVKIIHGQSVASASPCITCTCFYGNIVCQKPTCPIPKPGCRKSSVQDLTLCCPLQVCDDDIEAPTVVLDRIDGNLNKDIAVTVADKVLTPDPFKDVIRTEPAPNLQSLISDMMPFLARQTTPTEKRQLTTSIPKTSTTTEKMEKVETHTEDEFSLDKVFQFLFSGKNEENNETTTKNPQINKPEPQTSSTTTTAPPVTQKLKLPLSTTISTVSTVEIEDRIDTEPNYASSESSTGMALLINLAGCNIYGRMYRVGRIISELSGPCLECKCTEIGVQCRPLKC